MKPKYAKYNFINLENFEDFEINSIHSPYQTLFWHINFINLKLFLDSKRFIYYWIIWNSLMCVLLSNYLCFLEILQKVKCFVVFSKSKMFDKCLRKLYILHWRLSFKQNDLELPVLFNFPREIIERIYQ